MNAEAIINSETSREEGRMRIIASVLIAALILVGAGWAFIEFFYTYPDEVAAAYLDRLLAGDYPELGGYFHSQHPFPTASALEVAFANFADAYGLTLMELVGINPIAETFTAAEYTVDLRYESKYFDPLMVQFHLELTWDGLLNWKIIWKDNLPLPQHGLSVRYHRTRLSSSRGSIYDRQGRLLAGRGSVVAVGVQPGRITDPELLYEVTTEYLGLSRDYVQAQYQAPGIQDHWFVPLIVVSEERYQELDQILRPVPGIFFQRQYIRAYPLGSAAAHLTGYIGEVTEAMINQYPERDYQSGETGGRSGLELGLEPELRGRPGYRLFVEYESGINELFLERTPVEGKDVELAIDAQWQQIAYEVLGDRRGAFVVLDADSGEVLVLVSTPSYDPNEFVQGISHARWQQLSTDSNQPLFNRSLQGKYPPGSVFKVVTAAAALDLGLFTIESKFTDPVELRVQGNLIRNFQNQDFGEHLFADAVIHSINTTMAQVGLAVGAESLSHYFTSWGLDRAPDFKLPADSGQIGNPARSQVGLAWTSIGQDQVLVTPLNVAAVFTAFINEGFVPELTLWKADADHESTKHQVIKPETAAVMCDLLEQVVLEGTGQQAAVDQISICGKTGTAETGKGTSHAWFGGFVRDVFDRNLTFAVLVEEGGIGGQTAAPLVREFFTRLLARSDLGGN